MTPCSRQVLRFDTKELKLQQVASMRVARMGFKAVSSSNCDYIYVIGGQLEDGELTELVERFNVQENRWDMVAPLVTSRSAPSICRTVV